MNSLMSFQVYAVGVGLLIILFLRAAFDRGPHFIQFRLFLLMTLTVLICLLLELVTCVVDGHPGPLPSFIAKASSVLLFAFDLFPLMLWVLYIDFLIYQNRERLFGLGRILGTIFVLNLGMTAMSLPFGLYFRFDENNIFHRGDFFWVSASLYFSLLAYVVILPIVRRRVLPPDLRVPLLVCSVPSVLGVAAQISVYGLNLAWAGAALSLLVIYTSIQTRILTTDYLTGLYNRRQLDLYLMHRIKTLRPKEKLSVLMMDIDRFKMINDTYGHDVGDQAIECTAALLRKTFHHQDFLARYGGDEFAVILDYKHPDDLLSIRHRLRERCDAFNTEGSYPFSLSISVGVAVYDSENLFTPGALMKAADEEMYRDKKRINPFLSHRP